MTNAIKGTGHCVCGAKATITAVPGTATYGIMELFWQLHEGPGHGHLRTTYKQVRWSSRR
jgi:hypothetical protein